MKTKNPTHRMAAIVTSLACFIFSSVGQAQTFTVLHSFAAGSGSYPYDYTNSDGAPPFADLILSGNTLYGTAYGGGSSGKGTAFRLNIDGTGFTNLHSFTATSGPLSTNSDGAFPEARLILSVNVLYGT